MIIKKIVLKDFRQYKGRQQIIFSTDKKKNVTVVLGLNTSGKTTIIEAFKWCLYNESSYPKRELINVEIEKELKNSEKGQTYVEVTLIHEDTEYIIIRRQNYFKVNKNETTLKNSELSLSYKSESGNEMHIRPEETQDSINRILPEELSDYFFFDGERIGDIGNNRSDIKKSVQGLMGLDVITEAKKRLSPKSKNSVINRLERKLDIGSDDKAEKLTNEIDIEEDNLEEYKKNLKTVEGELKYYEDTLHQINNKIIANESVGEKQNKRIKLEEELKENILRFENLGNRIRRDFINKSVNLFSIPLIDRSLNTLSSTSEEVEGIEGMSAKAIEHIIDKGICICGNDLYENKEAKEKVLEQKKLLPPYHVGTMVNETKTSFKQIKEDGYNFKDDIFMDFKMYEALKKEVSDKEKELEYINEELEGDIDVGKLTLDRNENRRKMNELKDKKDQILLKIGSTENRIKTLRKNKTSLAVASDRNKEINKCIEYSKVLYESFESSYKSREKEVKESLEKNVNEIFKEIYHGERFINIDEDYNVSLDTKLSEEMITTAMSKGLEAVKNFSFVAGLVKIAKEKVKDTDEISLEEPYPLVMDAPFSNIDEKHIANISKTIPEVSEQVIWILMEKDWNYAKESLKDKVGYIYNIEKVNNSETYSKIREGELYV